MSGKDITEVPPSIPPPPSPLPPPTGNTLHDSLQSAKHITELPCGRNSLLTGIGSGFAVGVMRGLTAGPMIAGNWAVATACIVSLGSWHICQKRLSDERTKVQQIIESIPRRRVKETDSQPTG